MTQRSPGIFVACTENAVFMRVIGRGACRNSEPLRQFGFGKVREGFKSIFIDLRNCDGLDSTFLGVFAGLALALRDQGFLSLLNLKGENLRAFRCLGLDQIPSLLSPALDAAPVGFPAESNFQQLPGSDLTARENTFDALERALLMLECHEDLCRANERNEDKFRDVKHFLLEDIARHSNVGQNGHHPSDSAARP